MLLLGRQLINLEAHGIELELGDLLVEVLWNGVDLRLQVLRGLHHVLSGERLIGEAHIHHGGRVTFGGG